MLSSQSCLSEIYYLVGSFQLTSDPRTPGDTPVCHTLASKLLLEAWRRPRIASVPWHMACSPRGNPFNHLPGELLFILKHLPLWRLFFLCHSCLAGHSRAICVPQWTGVSVHMSGRLYLFTSSWWLSCRPELGSSLDLQCLGQGAAPSRP